MNDYIFKRSVQYHESIKEQLVSLISISPCLNHVTNTENHITDYHISTDITRTYEECIMPVVVEHIREFQTFYNFSGIKLHHLWFQKYKKGGFHSWHVHPFCHFTNVYYISLPNKTISTEIKGVNVTVNEGDILSFPSFLLHQSPVNTYDEEKLIVSFNTNII